MEKYFKAQDVCKAFADYIWSPLPRTVSYASSFVEKIPAADVAPVRHGQWVEATRPMGRDDIKCATCSECGEGFVLDEALAEWGIEDVKNFMLYCPHCGAKMDGGKRE